MDTMHCMQFDCCFVIIITAVFAKVDFLLFCILIFLLAHVDFFQLSRLCQLQCLLVEVDFLLVQVDFLLVPCCKAASWLGSYTALFDCCFVIIIVAVFAMVDFLLFCMLIFLLAHVDFLLAHVAFLAYASYDLCL